MLCCKAVSVATVSLVLVKGAANRNDQLRGGGTNEITPGFGFPVNGRKPVLNPTKFAIVIPDPCNAATTSSRLVSIPELT